jgi:serine/threonine-protein kinase
MTQPPVDETQYVPDSVGAPACSDHLGRYRVLGRLGTGASGTVYRAHDGDRVVAVKVLGTSNDSSVRMRFLNEARAISSVQHANILAVHETGTEGDAPYIVMELASGTLRDVMRARSLDVATVRTIGIQIAHALAAAHAAQILHRDVKPANILRSEAGSWKLGDFGIARLPDSTLTDTGQFLGSPSYAAPESLRAGQFTPASDVYALAATLYEAIAGAPPHGEHDMPSVVRKLSEDAIPLQLRCPVAPELADTIMAGLARDPAQRPTAADFARRLANEPVVVPETPAPAAAPNRRLRRIAIASALFAACFLAVAIARTRTSESAPVVHETKRVDRGKTVKPAQPSKPAPSVDDQTARDMLRRLERDARREMERVQGKRRRRLADDRRRGN